MERIKELKQVKDIRDNAVHQLLSMLPNYEVARVFANDLNCDIEDALIVANNLIPQIDIYYKRNDRYYHVYKYSMLLHEYTAEVVYVKNLEDSDGNGYIKYHTETTHLCILDFEDAEAITKDEFEFMKA